MSTGHGEVWGKDTLARSDYTSRKLRRVLVWPTGPPLVSSHGPMLRLDHRHLGNNPILAGDGLVGHPNLTRGTSERYAAAARIFRTGLIAIPASAPPIPWRGDHDPYK